ncbi:MAG: LysM peptidoglycan-binding domain-containing protein, partial [Myxococcota bacterium]|nr:LysM peptidoglycan-binding domain-containing protein [Myxococcota bacterium]
MYSATPHLSQRQLPRNAYARTNDGSATSPEHHTLPGHGTRPASLSALLLALFGVACLAWAFIQRGQAESSAAMAAEAPEPTHAQSEEMMRFGEAELPDAPLPKWALSPEDEGYPHVRQEAVEYRIQSGDTLGRIGQRFGCTVPQLMQANQLRSE